MLTLPIYECITHAFSLLLLTSTDDLLFYRNSKNNNLVQPDFFYQNKIIFATSALPKNIQAHIPLMDIFLYELYKGDILACEAVEKKMTGK